MHQIKMMSNIMKSIKVNEDESLTFLGASINENYFVNALTRDNKSNTTTFEVVAVNNDLFREMV